MRMHCRETLERAYLFLDGEVLSAAERREIHEHLEACRPCLERYGLEKEVAALLARLRGHSRCPSELRARISTLLRNA